MRIDAVGARCVRAASFVHARVCAVLSRSGQHREDGRRHFCNNFNSKVCLSVCLLFVFKNKHSPWREKKKNMVPGLLHKRVAALLFF